MNSILLVDDEPNNLLILSESLDDESYKLAEARNGEEAWALLTRENSDFDCVVLDRKMPGMDGLELVRRAKADPRLRDIPLILHTAYAAPNEITEGLALGVFCYLTKPSDPRVIRASVRAALLQHAEWRALSADLAQQLAFVHLLTHANFELRALNEAHALAAALGKLARDAPAASLGLNELLVNAIEHGNLMIDYEEKSRLLDSGNWLEEIARRQRDLKFSERRVRIDLKCAKETVAVTIADEGAGFDWAPYMIIHPERAFHLHGRGIVLARQLSFRTLEYSGNGNTVSVTFDRAA
ncbi:MAG: response regulator [Burkholderiales bacterium]